MKRRTFLSATFLPVLGLPVRRWILCPHWFVPWESVKFKCHGDSCLLPPDGYWKVEAAGDYPVRVYTDCCELIHGVNVVPVGQTEYFKTGPRSI